MAILNLFQLPPEIADYGAAAAENPTLVLNQIQQIETTLAELEDGSLQDIATTMSALCGIFDEVV